MANTVAGIFLGIEIAKPQKKSRCQFGHLARYQFGRVHQAYFSPEPSLSLFLQTISRDLFLAAHKTLVHSA
ncbi:hypothetical protein N9B14_02620, partial [Akkermansiaceae bacterium]|nr:hypothetical protein [Akkermansiaceae bacterium]